MKKILVFVMLVAIVTVAMCGLTGCSYFGSVTYKNSEEYSVGDTEISQRVEKIEIDWPSGSVNLVSHSENTLLLTEKTEDGISDDLRVHWWLEDTTLHVKFAASGAGMRLFGTWHKELTLTVPEALHFNDVVICTASAKINVSDLATETLSVSTASGDMDISCMANTIRLNSASGDIKLDQKDKADDISIDTASGKISANLNRADNVNVDSVSGKINITADLIDSLSANAVSGEVFCKLEVTPSECKLNAVSGKVTLILPDDSDFTAKISTTSGDFESDFSLKKSGNTYICGNGSANIEIKTTSGDVSIRQK